jgi:hypothetical protein
MDEYYCCNDSANIKQKQGFAKLLALFMLFFCAFERKMRQ